MIDTPDEPQPIHKWTVVPPIEDVFGPAMLGGSNRMKRVTYKLANGDTSYVDVPYGPNWVNEASRMIERDVDMHYDALMLKSLETT